MNTNNHQLEETTVKTWHATQTRHLPVFDAARPMVGIESNLGAKQAERGAGRWRG
jgi:hypothetical protein